MRPLSILLALVWAGTAALVLPPPAGATITTVPMPQEWQHKDSECCVCIVNDPPWCPTGNYPHEVFCAPIAPWGCGCPHCGAYSAPASILMVHRYRGHVDCPQRQDCVYERNMDLPGNFIIESHGIGMKDDEIFRAFLDAMGEIHCFSNGLASPGVEPITPWVLRQLICMGTPVLWIDRDGLPGAFMNPATYVAMVARGCGHVKVLAGYDDLETYCNTVDDMVQVYDPWPSPGDCPYPKSPYWVPANQVLYAGEGDIFISDRVGGALVADGPDMRATAWSNGRHLVQDESDGSYNTVFSSWGHIYFSKSLRPNVTETWTVPMKIDSSIGDHIASEPVIAISPGVQGYNPLHVVWAESGLPGGPDDIFYSMSADGGRTWSPAERVYESTMEDSRHPSLDVDGMGVLHLVWDETGLDFGREIFYSHRTNDAAAWTQPENISRTGNLDSSFPAIATSYDGTEWGDPPTPAMGIHVAWVERNPDALVSTIVYRMMEPATGWIPPLDRPPEDVTGGLGGTSPSVIVGPDRAAKVVWTTSREEPEAIPTTASSVYYNERTGGIWGSPQMVSPPDDLPGTPSICPTIAFANGPFCSCLHVTWEEWDPWTGSGDVWVAMRSGMTMQWEARTRITYDAYGFRRFPNLAYKNGTYFTKGYDLVWTDPNFHFEAMVRFLGTSRVGPTAPMSTEPVVVKDPATLRAWPNPFRDRVLLEGPASIAGSRLEVFDITGRLVRELAASGAMPVWAWDGSERTGRLAPEGIYFVRPRDRSLGVRRVILLR